MRTNLKQCLVCVGSTEFDELIRVLDTPDFLNLLEFQGYESLVVQTGKGSYQCQHLNDYKGLKVEKYDFVVLEPIIN